MNLKIAILGFGREGKSILNFLKKTPPFQKTSITVLDIERDPRYLQKLKQFDLIFRSPGVPYNLPVIQTAIKSGVAVASATKLFFDLCPGTIIGITGTKGKGTTSTLLYQILRHSGKKVVLAGNIGTPMLDVLPKIDKKTLVILELSSFQLQDLKKSPPIAVIVDIFPDHLDVHKNMKEYLEAKANIARHQTKNDVVFYFKANRLSKKMALLSPGRKIPVAAPDDLSKNFIMAAMIARHLGCLETRIQTALKSFSGLSYRLERVRILESTAFYNDSASTNPQTTAMAIRTLAKEKAPIILIAGGKDKNLNYAPLAKTIKNTRLISAVIIFGENRDKIKRAVGGAASVLISKNLQSAINLAWTHTRKYPKAVVLFSPGAASFDMFKDYQDRGAQFTKIVKSLKSK